MDFNEYFSNRRTVRNYDITRDIPDSLLEKMLRQASQAPNTGNMQTYSVIVTRKKDYRAALAPAHFNQPAILNAPVILTFCLDFNRFNEWCRINDTIPGLNNLQGFTWGVIDTAIFAQQFCTIAEMNGLGTCYLGTTTYNAESISRTLNLPDDVVPVITVTLGYPAEQPEKSDRLPIEAIIHREHYHRANANEVKEIYSEKESLSSSKTFVAENSKDNLAQVYAEVRYPREANEKFSKVYNDFLKNKGIPL